MALLQSPLLIAESHDPLAVSTHRRRPWDRLLTRWRSLGLDRDLAAGAAPDDSRMLMIRAEQLISPGSRRELARRWDDVLERCARDRGDGRTRIPLQYRQIRAAESEIRRMARMLEGGLPVQVRAVAVASLLLTDGTGPLYNPAACEELPAWVRLAVETLDPATLC
jgi:hypothetical protein